MSAFHGLRAICALAFAAGVLFAGGAPHAIAAGDTVTSSITAKVSAPTRLYQSPFVIAFSAPVTNVDTTGAVGTDLTVSDVKRSDAYPGQAVCYDASTNPIDCGKGPVSSVQFTTAKALLAGQYYQVNLGSKILDASTGQPLTPSETVVRAQTVFGPNEWGESYTWQVVPSGGIQGGSFIAERAPNATAVYSFTGTSLGLGMASDYSTGYATVAITQVGGPTISETMDTYSRHNDPSEQLWWWRSLLPGRHRLTITTTGMSDPDGLDSWVQPDAVWVDGVENATPNFTVTWGHLTSWRGHPAWWSGTGGVNLYAEASRASTILTFYGRSVTIGYFAGPQMGTGSIAIDRSPRTMWSLDENTAGYGSTTWTSPTLALGMHRLAIYGESNGDPGQMFNYRTITIH